MPPMHRKILTSRVVTQHLYSKSLRSIVGKPIRTNAAYRTLSGMLLGQQTIFSQTTMTA